ncbi:DUF6252 family protein [Mesonia sp.]|uniref:DUF6252 family protein n=1 Tax=Mesonia sp. TaxID=1960830 RepID=UPI00175083AB|nr:DUF6252 family protein [Mesonia sp.]HIB37440.1 hypothetical protein [Mesonia sp.]HIO26168.1 hypothetical protein [Flavobacteriaceae bacterium]
MKKILYPIFLALFTLMAVSCDNEPLEGDFADPNAGGSGGGSGTPGGNFTATIDGNSFVADGALAITQSTGNGVQTGITGVNLSGNSIAIQLLDEGVGSYVLSNLVDFDNPGDGTAMYAQLGTEGPPYTTNMNSTGTLEITEWDTQNMVISGTFSFQAEREIDNEDGSVTVETVEVTEGEFSNVPLQLEGGEEPTDPEPEDPDALFEVELDGDLYTGTTQANINEDGFAVAATSGDQVFTLQVFDPVVGSFDLGAEDEAFILYDIDESNDESELYYSIEGTITISSIDYNNNLISGTFSGTLTEFISETQIQMTNGVFENISFSTEGPVDNASALVDGEEFVANTFAEGSLVGGDEVSLNFISDLDNSIVLNIPQNPEVGTYSISENPPYSASYIADLDTANEVVYDAQADSGEITITSFENNTVVGTFSFVGEADNGDTITITEGEFSYQF